MSEEVVNHMFHVFIFVTEYDEDAHHKCTSGYNISTVLIFQLSTTRCQWHAGCISDRERERENQHTIQLFFFSLKLCKIILSTWFIFFGGFGISLVSIVATGVSISNANLQWCSKCDGRRSREYLFRPAADLLSSVSSLSEDARQALQKCFQYQCNSESDKVKFCFISVSTNVQNFCNISGISSAGGLILILK